MFRAPDHSAGDSHEVSLTCFARQALGAGRPHLQDEDRDAGVQRISPIFSDLGRLTVSYGPNLSPWASLLAEAINRATSAGVSVKVPASAGQHAFDRTALLDRLDRRFGKEGLDRLPSKIHCVSGPLLLQSAARLRTPLRFVRFLVRNFRFSS